MRYIYTTLACLIIFSCRSTKIDDTCNTQLNFTMDMTIGIPCFKSKKIEIEYHGQKQYNFNYDNNCIFFVSDNSNETPMLLSKYLSKEQNSSFVFRDSLSYVGKDNSNNTYWRVTKKQGFLTGYINVLEERKSEFDKAINSFNKELK